MQSAYWAFLVIAVEFGAGQLVVEQPPPFDYNRAGIAQLDPARQWSAEAWDANGVMIGVVWQTHKDGTEKIMRFDGTFFTRPVSPANKGK